MQSHCKRQRTSIVACLADCNVMELNRKERIENAFILSLALSLSLSRIMNGKWACIEHTATMHKAQCTCNNRWFISWIYIWFCMRLAISHFIVSAQRCVWPPSKNHFDAFSHIFFSFFVLLQVILNYDKCAVWFYYLTIRLNVAVFNLKMHSGGRNL